MCGRYEMIDKGDIVEELCRRLRNEGKVFKVGEIFPTERAAAVVKDGSRLVLDVLKWDYGRTHFRRPIINARAESVVAKSFFSNDFINRRCLLLMSGFYEWSPKRVKHFYSYKNPLFLAGFYDPTKSFTILTKEAIEPISLVHGRMPVLVTVNNGRRWLNDDEFAREYICQGFTEPLTDTVIDDGGTAK